MRRGAALVFGMGVAASVQATDLGVFGQVYEPIEEDVRVLMLKLVAERDWQQDLDGLKQSAENYTANLPANFLPRATETRTQWKDVGIEVTEDVYFPYVDWETGSVLEPEQRLAVPKGTYFNPLVHLSLGIPPRMLVFDATDPEQLAFAQGVAALNIPALQLISIAGDVAKLTDTFGRPVYYGSRSMFEPFALTAVPTLVGFGEGAHLGHLAATQIKLPAAPESVHAYWFGLGGRPGPDFEQKGDTHAKLP